MKSFTKILSTRVQSVLPTLIQANQYSFLKTRTTKDCLAWAFQFLHFWHHFKTEYPFILEILRQKRFSEKWISWVNFILSSATSSVLLNGIQASPSNVEEGLDKGTNYPHSLSLLHIFSRQQ